MANEKMNTNEILNDEQLDSVSGGSINEVAADSETLYNLGILGDKFDKLDTTISWDKVTDAVETSWKKVGVLCVTKPLNKNEYTYKGQQISRGDAMLIARNYAEKNNLIPEN